MEEYETFDGFLTKYVGTIAERQFRRQLGGNWCSSIGAGPYCSGRLDRDIWRTREEAEADARWRVQRKIKSLVKQIAALQAGPYSDAGGDHG